MSDNKEMKLTPLQRQRYEIMKLVAKNIADERVVLKGGTGLILCYGLDRFSEDMDFDPYSEKFKFDKFQKTLERYFERTI